MTQFTKSFLLKFILLALAAELLLTTVDSTIISRVIDRVSRSANIMSKPQVYAFFIVIFAVSSVVGMLIMYRLASNSITSEAKSCRYDFPVDTDKWFRTFAFLLITPNIISAAFQLVAYRSATDGFTGMVEGMSYSVIKYGFEEQLDHTLDMINTLFIASVVGVTVQIIVGIVVTLLILPKLKKKCNDIIKENEDMNRMITWTKKDR